ncbi:MULTISPECIES: hypothetical protein [unclassified Enterococcus]|uniref:hypothetical protein n=1 Tax=unclassified Enterococcus TaxID=2608891 RepID=UPI0013ED65EB|nr:MULTISPECIES: hypothetical protein [unclassified Enterococcus]
MELQRKTTLFLYAGSFFSGLTILFFICFVYFKTSTTPCNAFGWLLLDHSDVGEIEDNPFFLILSSLCGLIFSVYFGAYFFHQKPGKLNEASVVLIALKLFSFIAILFYSFNHNSLLFFILNGLIVILTIFTFFLFSLIFNQLKLSMFFRLIPVLCFGYSVFSFLVLAMAPSIDPANIQITSNYLDLLFIGCLGLFMRRTKKGRERAV